MRISAMKLILYFLLSLLAILSLPTYADDNPGFEFFNRTSTPINITWSRGLGEEGCLQGDKSQPVQVQPNQSSGVISVFMKVTHASTKCPDDQKFSFTIKDSSTSKTNEIQINRIWSTNRNMCTVTVKNGDYKILTETGSPCSTAHFHISVHPK